jgi:hypothetical protein
LSKGKYQRLVQPKLKYNFSNIDGDNKAPSFFPAGNYHTLETGITMYAIHNKSQQELIPRFGLLTNISYLNSLPGFASFGNLFASSSIIYLPAFHINHGITIYAAFQVKQSREYSFSDRVRFPRGHVAVENERFYSVQTDYSFPLFYPDINIGPLLYLKRLQMKIFYDFASYSGILNYIENKDIPYSGLLQSTGLEIKSDVHLLRFIAPIELGLRGSYRFEKGFGLELLYAIKFDL